MGINVTRYADGFYLSYTGSSVDYNADKYIHWYVDGTRYYPQDTIYPGNLTSQGIRVSGLNHYTWYDIDAKITWYSGGGGTKWEYTSARTLAKPVITSLVAQNITKKSAEIYCQSLYGNRYDISIYNSSMSSLIDRVTGDTDGRHTFYGLKASTTYLARVTAYSGDNISEVWDRYFTTLSNVRPLNWWWSNSARNAFTNKGFTNEVSYTEWNDFVQRVEDFHLWYWNAIEDPSGIKNAKMSSSDKTLYASKFNLVRSAIGAMNATGITDRVKGDTVTGNYFLVLENRMNAVSSPRHVLEETYEVPTEEEAVDMYKDMYNEIYGEMYGKLYKKE